MSPGKHAATRLSTYLQVHENRYQHCLSTGFIEDDDLAITALNDRILMEGDIRCLGGIVIRVRKTIRVVVPDDKDPTVETSSYSYNVHIEGLGNIFRYDGPQGHRAEHHVHRYDVVNGDTSGTVDPIYEEDERPTLSEVVQEASDWYHAHLEFLAAHGLVKAGH